MPSLTQRSSQLTVDSSGRRTVEWKKGPESSGEQTETDKGSRTEKKVRPGKENVRNQKVRKRKDQQKEVSYEIKRTSGDSEILTGAEAWKFQARKKSCDRKLFAQLLLSALHLTPKMWRRFPELEGRESASGTGPPPSRNSGTQMFPLLHPLPFWMWF